MSKRYKEYLFVDGYNIINSWNKLRALNEISLEASRNKLIEILSEYQAYTGIKVVIVFDAHLVKGSFQKKEDLFGVEIIYTKEKETADSYIERIIDSLGRKEKVRVATSDSAIQQITLGRGGTRISARELEVEILEIKETIKRRKNNSKRDKSNQNQLQKSLKSDTLEKLEKLRRKI